LITWLIDYLLINANDDKDAAAADAGTECSRRFCACAGAATDFWCSTLSRSTSPIVRNPSRRSRSVHRPGAPALVRQLFDVSAVVLWVYIVQCKRGENNLSSASPAYCCAQNYKITKKHSPLYRTAPNKKLSPIHRYRGKRCHFIFDYNSCNS